MLVSAADDGHFLHGLGARQVTSRSQTSPYQDPVGCGVPGGGVSKHCGPGQYSACGGGKKGWEAESGKSGKIRRAKGDGEGVQMERRMVGYTRVRAAHRRCCMTACHGCRL